MENINKYLTIIGITPLILFASSFALAENTFEYYRGSPGYNVHSNKVPVTKFPIVANRPHYWEDPPNATPPISGLNYYYSHPDVRQHNWVWYDHYCTSKVYVGGSYSGQYFCLYEAGLPEYSPSSSTFSLKDFNELLEKPSVSLLLSFLNKTIPDEITASDGNLLYSQTETISPALFDDTTEALVTFVNLAIMSAMLGTSCNISADTESTVNTKVSVFNSTRLGFEKNGTALTLSGDLQGWAGVETHGANLGLNCSPSSSFYSLLWSVSPEVQVEPYVKVIIPMEFEMKKKYKLQTRIYDDRVDITARESTELSQLSESERVIDVRVVAHADVDLSGLASILGIFLFDADEIAEELKRDLSEKVKNKIITKVAEAESDLLDDFESGHPDRNISLASLRRSEVENNEDLIAALENAAQPKTSCGRNKINNDTFATAVHYLDNNLDNDLLRDYVSGNDTACILPALMIVL